MASPRVPVLVYHKVGSIVSGVTDRFINVTSDQFDRHMRFMTKRGFTAITFAHSIAGLAGHTPLPKRSFVITFDDGYRSVYDHAAPVLAKYSYPATVFVVSGAVGRVNEWDRSANRPILPLMDWDELRRLNSLGWEIGGHTVHHPRLSTLSRCEQQREIEQGRCELEARLGVTINTFCYPYGDWTIEARDALREGGFVGACTTVSGMARADADPLLLPRVKLAHRDGVLGLWYKLNMRSAMPTLRRESRLRR